MDSAKARRFNEKMGRPKYSKGGYIKKLGNREYFDAGGIATNPIAPMVGGPGNPTNTNTTGIGGIAGALGLNAQSANIQQGTNAAQLNNAYTGANNAINAQVGLTNTLTPQASTAANNQNEVAAQELAMTKGAGPNPALNQLAQTTGTNVSNEAALLAGQRGAGANPGLVARNIGTVGGQTLEGGAGDAATLEAQQQIAAQNNLTNLSGQQIGEAQGAVTGLNTAQQNEQNILQTANGTGNNAAVGMQSNINNVNAGNNKSILGGITSGLSSLTGGLLNKGGEVKPVDPHAKHKLEFVHKMTKMGLDHFDEGGSVNVDKNDPSLAKTSSNFFSHFGSQEAQASDVPPQDKYEQIREQNAKNAGHANGGVIGYANGGPIGPNPLVGAITNNNPMMSPGPSYNQVGSVTGPNIEQTKDLDSNLGDSIKSGFKSGQDWKAKKPINQANAGLGEAQNTFNNDLSEGSPQEIVAGGLGSDQFAKGGSIWNMPPMHHAEMSATHFSQYFSKGGSAKEVPAMVSPGERYWNPREVDQIKHGADPMKLGRIIPGKDKVPGKDSLKNDTVPATLEEGGIINPLHIEKTKNPDKARLFVLKSLRATGRHLKRPSGMN